MAYRFYNSDLPHFLTRSALSNAAKADVALTGLEGSVKLNNRTFCSA